MFDWKGRAMTEVDLKGVTDAVERALANPDAKTALAEAATAAQHVGRIAPKLDDIPVTSAPKTVPYSDTFRKRLSEIPTGRLPTEIPQVKPPDLRIAEAILEQTADEYHTMFEQWTNAMNARRTLHPDEQVDYTGMRAVAEWAKERVRNS